MSRINEQLLLLEKGMQKLRLKNNTPEKARAGLIANGYLNEDGSPSPIYYDEESIADFHESLRLYKEGRDWIFLNQRPWWDYVKRWY